MPASCWKLEMPSVGDTVILANWVTEMMAISVIVPLKWDTT